MTTGKSNNNNEIKCTEFVTRMRKIIIKWQLSRMSSRFIIIIIDV